MRPVAVSGDRRVRGLARGVGGLLLAVVPLSGAPLAEPGADDPCRWSVSERARWGSVDGPDALAPVAAGARAPSEDVVLIAEPAAHRVRLFDLGGGELPSIGRDGVGPGEFRSPVLTGFFGDDVWVWDLAIGRLSYISASTGRFLDSRALPTGGRAAALTDGSALYVARTPPSGAPQERLVSRVPESVRDPAEGDTLHVMSLRAGTLQIRAGEVTRVSRQPFSDDPLWAVAPNGQWVVVLDRRTGGDRARVTMPLHSWLPGSGGVRRIEVPYEPLDLPVARVDSLATVLSESMVRTIRTRGIAADPADFTPQRVREAFHRPAWTPPAPFIVVTSGGSAWIRTQTADRAPQGDLAPWTVVELESGERCWIDLPADWHVLDAGERIGVAHAEGPFGVAQIVVFDLMRAPEP